MVDGVNALEKLVNVLFFSLRQCAGRFTVQVSCEVVFVSTDVWIHSFPFLGAVFIPCAAVWKVPKAADSRKLLRFRVVTAGLYPDSKVFRRIA